MKNRLSLSLKILILPFILFCLANRPGVSQNYSRLVYPDHSGKLVYEKDDRGSHIPDYSVAGYMGGGVPIPDVPVVKTIEPGPGDDTWRIQKAIDWVAENIPIGADHYRGAVLLTAGVYHISSTIHFRQGQNGIVLRGEGAYGNGTIIFHKGTDQETSIQISGGTRYLSKVTSISDDFVPVGAKQFQVNSTEGLSVGQKIVVKCLHTQKWIRALEQEDDWHSSQFRVDWERIITDINTSNNTITLNGPITTQIDQGNGYATGEVHAITSDTRISHIGIEDLIIMSDYNRSVRSQGYYVDENHARIAILLHSGHDCWIRRVTGYFHFWCLVRSRNPFYRATIEDCAMIDGISTDTHHNHTGTRDYSFLLGGNQILCQRCYGRHGRHTFVMGGPVSGNVFLDCYSELEHLSCEPHQKWTHGALYDNVYNDAIFKLSRPGGGHGWRAANCMFWNITCKNHMSGYHDIWLDKPFKGLGKQWAIGIINNGKGHGIANPHYSFADTAHLESVGTFVDPRSLYLAQLKDRSGDTAVAKIASAEQYISCQAAWKTMLDQYQDIPHWGNPKDLDWLPKADYFCKSGNSPVIDGIIDSSWMLPPSYPVHKQILGNPASDNDLSGYFKAKWDQNHLYLLIEISDSTLVNDSPDHPREDDAVAIFIDGNNDRAIAYDENDHQFIIRWNDPFIYEYQDTAKTINPQGVSIAQDTTSGGYIVETQISWDAIGVSPSNRSLIGFDLQLIDDDTGGSPDKKIAWVSNFHHPVKHHSALRTVLLKDEPCGKCRLLNSPEDKYVKCHYNTFFRIQAENVHNYQWQVDEGQGFKNLAMSNTYSGVHTDSLKILNAPFALLNNQYRCKISNDLGSFISQPAVLTVKDYVNPRITSKHNDTIMQADSNCQAILPDFTPLVKAEDNCDTQLDISQTPKPGSTIYGSNNQIRLSATDEAGKKTKTSFNIQVMDQNIPSVSCKNDTTIDLLPGETTYSVSGSQFDPVIVADNCEITRLSNNFNGQDSLKGSAFPVGITTVTWTVADKSGNTATCSFDVTINQLSGLNAFHHHGISIYPNPSNGIIHYLSHQNNIQHLMLTDLTGKKIMEMNALNKKGSIDLSHLKPGMYILKIHTRKQTFTTKMVIQ